ncbi:MAG TPA: multiheme c-type cytochrome, partial [Gemmataceae bacterium]|nr:multiheme c-type cytochrome [Gemmataceae bacterium]
MAGQQAPLFRPGFRRRIWGLASLAGLLACLAGVAVWQWRWQNRPSVLRLPADSPPPAVSSDPRLTVDTVYRNVRPDVRYVGDQTCAHCHAKITRTYHQHPMGRSLVPVAGRGPGQPDAAIPDAEFQARGFHYQVKPQGNRTVHREMKLDPQGHVIAKTEAEVAFAVGSSTRGRSFLIDHNGYLFQSPITWYPQKGGWDLSPGYASRHHHFARPVTPECLFCHSNRAEHEGGTINHYRPPIFQGYAIGCERCHGPGELHVRRHEQGEASTGPDTTIVNPQNLEPALRDAVCEQCHLQGEIRVPGRGRSSFDYRPGLPLHQFMTVFVSAANSAEASKFVGQVEQMHASRCWNASGGRMGCVSCHDPHQMPAAAERVGFYRDHCLSCHEPNSCTLPAGQRSRVSAQDSCIDCHMPAAKSDIPHASTTDHRIPRRVDHARSEDRNARPAFSRETS